MASSSTSSSAFHLTTFARGVLAIVELWPALRLAVSEQWGGTESEDKRTWIASSIIDLFEEALTAPSIEDTTAPIDQDDLADMLHGMILDEFEADLDDGSPDGVATDVIKLWTEVISGKQDMVVELEGLAEKNRGKKVQAVNQGGDEDDESGSEDDSEDDDGEGKDEKMDVDDQPPKLVERKEPQEPVVDEDGFTLVQGKGKGRK
jgi:pre-rRNA-processing protein TSR2